LQSPLGVAAPCRRSTVGTLLFLPSKRTPILTWIPACRLLAERSG